MRVKCSTCGVEISKDVPMSQTVEQWRYTYSLAEKAMFKDKAEISKLKAKINKLENRSKRPTRKPTNSKQDINLIQPPFK